MRRLRLMECQNGSNFKVLTRSNMYFQIIILIIIIVMIIIITKRSACWDLHESSERFSVYEQND